jgi:hypothetical protein
MAQTSDTGVVIATLPEVNQDIIDTYSQNLRSRLNANNIPKFIPSLEEEALPFEDPLGKINYDQINWDNLRIGLHQTSTRTVPDKEKAKGPDGKFPNKQIVLKNAPMFYLHKGKKYNLCPIFPDANSNGGIKAVPQAQNRHLGSINMTPAQLKCYQGYVDVCKAYYEFFGLIPRNIVVTCKNKRDFDYVYENCFHLQSRPGQYKDPADQKTFESNISEEAKAARLKDKERYADSFNMEIDQYVNKQGETIYKSLLVVNKDDKKISNSEIQTKYSGAHTFMLPPNLWIDSGIAAKCSGKWQTIHIKKSSYKMCNPNNSCNLNDGDIPAAPQSSPPTNNTHPSNGAVSGGEESNKQARTAENPLPSALTPHFNNSGDAQVNPVTTNRFAAMAQNLQAHQMETQVVA